MTSRRGEAGQAGGRAGPSFRRGFRNRNPLILLTAGLLLLPAILGVQAFFTSGSWTTVPLKHWLVKQSDDYTYVAWTVTNHKANPADVPTVYLLGGSSAREAITSGHSLAAEVRKLGGPRIAAYNLGSMNQNFAQSTAIVDNLPDTPTTVLVGINTGRFTPDKGASQTQAEGRPIILDSDFIRDYVKRTSGKYDYTYTILPGIFTYLTTYAEMHQSELLSFDLPERDYGHHRYRYETRHNLKQKQRMVGRWNKQRAPVFRHNIEYNLTMLDQLLGEAERRGIDVIMVELPRNDEVIGDAFDWARQMYVPAVESLAEKHDVPYVDFNDELPLTNDDFEDLSHLVEPGRKIWQTRLAEELVRLLGDQDPGAQSGASSSQAAASDQATAGG